MEILLASPRGFCAGVENAIDALNRTLELYGPPVYVNHDIVHNKTVIESFQSLGVVFLQDINEVPEGSVLLLSAHGVGENYETLARSKAKIVIDATCPLVSKVHRQAHEYESSGRKMLVIGHIEHKEVQGTLQRLQHKAIVIQNIQEAMDLDLPNDTKIAYVSQTTLSVDEVRSIIEILHKKFSDVVGPSIRNICYATQNRQEAVKKIIDICDVLLVIGSEYSSNTMRLYEIGKNSDIDTYIIDNYQQINYDWFINKMKVGITSGASAPEFLVQEIVEHLKKKFVISSVSDISAKEEKIRFLPVNIM